jgi:hypothetical protein
VAIASRNALEKENGAIVMKCCICGAQHSVSYKGVYGQRESATQRGSSGPSKNSTMGPCIQSAYASENIRCGSSSTASILLNMTSDEITLTEPAPNNCSIDGNMVTHINTMHTIMTRVRSSEAEHVRLSNIMSAVCGLVMKR